MKGTEKQINWASEIRQNIIDTMQAAVDMFAPQAAANAIIRANIAGLEERMARLNEDDVYAGDIIDLFKDVRMTGDREQDLGNVLAVYNVAHPNTEGQHRILMK